MSKRTCTAEDCDKPHYGRGFCRKHYAADHYRRNREAYKSKAATWRAENAERASELEAARYRRDSEAIKLRAQAWNAANPDRKAATRREWTKANAERKAAADRQWHAAHKDDPDYKRKRRQRAARRYALKRLSQVGPVDYSAILAEHGMFCHICSMVIVDETDLHFDHVIPLALGGPHVASNIKPSHALCNMRKGYRPPA